MGPLAQFIIALTNLVRSGAIRKIPQAIKFAEQQFGKVTPLLKKQIEKVFDSAKKPVVGKPGKKEGTVIPMVKEIAKKEEGIATLEDAPTIEGQMEKIEGASKRIDELMKEREAMYKPKPEQSELMKRLDDAVDMLQNNPRRPGGGLDPSTGLTRALARRVLERKGIEIGKKDPIDVFTNTFGESINDVNNLAEEMLEIDARGGGMKDMDQMLEADGLFDIEIPKNPSKGLTDEEMLEIQKAIDEENILLNFDPKGRKPSAKGGIMNSRISLNGGGSPLQKLKQEIVDSMKPYAPGVPESKLQIIVKDITLDMTPEEAQASAVSNFQKIFGMATGGRVQAAGGGLADLLKLK
jgi:hypothetical protein